MLKKFFYALRGTLEIFGVGAIIAIVAFYCFPGALRGLGVSDAIQRAASQASVAPPAPPLSPADLAAILLAVATIVLATVAFFLSIGAFIGFSELRTTARETSSEEIKKAYAMLFEEMHKDRQELSLLRAKLTVDIGELMERVREELSQAGGLPSGQGADAFAQASSSAETQKGIDYADIGDISGKIERVLVDGKAAFTITLNSAHAPTRQRFTLAHEIAHFIKHRKQLEAGNIVDNALYRSLLPEPMEWEANRYAAQLLMPLSAMKKLWGEGIRSPLIFAVRLGVSEQAAEIRLSQLKGTLSLLG